MDTGKMESVKNGSQNLNSKNTNRKINPNKQECEQI